MTLDKIFSQRRKPNEISTSEIEQWLNITRATVNNWRNQGLLTPVRYIKRHGNIYSLEQVKKLALGRGYNVDNGNS